ncbi:MAG: MscL family protein, partial [Pseudomonadota bacterium]
FIGGIDFSDMMLMLGEGEEAAAVKYGNFIMAVIKFIIVAWVVFLLVKGVNRLKDQLSAQEDPEPEAPKGPTQEELLAEIRDAIKAGNA